MERNVGVISEEYLEQLADSAALVAHETYRMPKHVVGPVGLVSFFTDRTQCSGRTRSNFVSNCMGTFSLLSTPLSGKVRGSISENCEKFQRRHPVSWNSFEQGTFRLRILSATEFERNVW